MPHTAPLDEDPNSAADPRTPAYWLPRLVLRLYSNENSQAVPHELSALIERDGTRHFFPLGTNDAPSGAKTASAIYALVTAKGWSAACSARTREFTIAIVWNWGPFASTYTTLRSLPSPPDPDAKRIPDEESRSHSVKGLDILLIEPDDSIRRSIQSTLNSQAGFTCKTAVATATQAARLTARPTPALILANRSLDETPAGPASLAALTKALKDMPIFRFGVFGESNYIFHSVSGVPSGYILRRRSPKHLLEPISTLPHHATLTLETLQREIRRYFQSLFDRADGNAPPSPLASLTQRELEILDGLSKGSSDKEIADHLRISVWTVHGHVKRIFEKLGVHSRTEAVVRCLQH